MGNANSLFGQGKKQIISIGDPGLATQFSFVVPVGQIWLFDWVKFKFAADGTGINRICRVRSVSGANNGPHNYAPFRIGLADTLDFQIARDTSELAEPTPTAVSSNPFNWRMPWMEIDGDTDGVANSFQSDFQPIRSNDVFTEISAQVTVWLK